MAKSINRADMIQLVNENHHRVKRKTNAFKYIQRKRKTSPDLADVTSFFLSFIGLVTICYWIAVL